MLGDQEPRDDEEDVNPDIATRDARQAGVIRHHGQNGDGA
jgi:hypothetical protein